MAIRAFVFAALAAILGLSMAGQALAAPPRVEIIAMRHPPVQATLAPLRAWLAEQGKKVSVVEIDAESAAGCERLEKIGLRGHIPIVILIDGVYRHKLKAGTSVDLVNFPDIPGAPPAVRGKWSTADVQAMLAARIK